MRLPPTLLSLAAALLTPCLPVAAQPTIDTVRVSTRATTRSGHSLEIIDRAALDRLPGLSLAQVLARGLGVDVQLRSAASADVAVRGGNYSQVLVLLDGVRVTDAQTAHFSLDLPLPLDDVERIEILRGGASALHGPDAAGGVINIVTRRGAARSVRVDGGSFGTARLALAAGHGSETGSMRVAAEYASSDGHRPGTDYDVQQLRVALSRTMSGTRLGLDAAYARRDFGANAFYGPYNSAERTGTSLLAVRAEHAAGTRGVVRAGLSYRRHDDDFVLRRENPAAYENLHTNTMLFGEFSVRQAVTDRLSVVAGVEAGQWTLASFRLGDHAESRLAAFVEAARTVADATVTAAGRVDHSSVSGDAFSPSLTMRIPLSAVLIGRASLARGIRAPSWTERYYKDPVNQGKAALGVETFWTADLGLRREFRRGAVELTGFGRRSHDLIDWTKPAVAGSVMPWTAMNVGEATLQGAELAVDMPGVAGFDWRVRAQGTRFVSDLDPAIIGKYALRPLTRSGGLTATRALRAGVTVSADLLHARRAGEDDYTTVDARFAWQSGPWRVTLDGTNLGRARWIDVAGKPAAGPGLFTGLSWTAR
ncbi:MAG: TonB-dependent receptor [Gemmatimonadetes bacterium]|nr:TonB-dependent receptor [Gemmatimonadota bacterium]